MILSVVKTKSLYPLNGKSKSFKKFIGTYLDLSPNFFSDEIPIKSNKNLTNYDSSLVLQPLFQETPIIRLFSNFFINSCNI